MISLVIDTADDAFRQFLDGRLVTDSRKGMRINPGYNIGLSEWFNITGVPGSFVHFHNVFDDRASHRTSPALFRVADMRLYPRALTEAELQKVHEESRWPVATEWPPQGGLMRQVLQIDDSRIVARLWARGCYSSAGATSTDTCVRICLHVCSHVRMLCPPPTHKHPSHLSISVLKKRIQTSPTPSSQTPQTETACGTPRTSRRLPTSARRSRQRPCAP